MSYSILARHYIPAKNISLCFKLNPLTEDLAPAANQFYLTGWNESCGNVIDSKMLGTGTLPEDQLAVSF